MSCASSDVGQIPSDQPADPLETVVDGAVDDAAAEPTLPAEHKAFDANATGSSVQSLLLADLNSIETLDTSEPSPEPSPNNLPAAISALQRRNGLPATAGLGQADVLLLRSVYGQDLFGPTIALAETKLAAAGYHVGLVDQDFDRLTQLALAALSHDTGREPDSTLSPANLRSLDSIETQRTECVSTPVPYDFSTTQALIDHVEQLDATPSIVMIEPPKITGDRDLDQRIVDRALERGYQLRTSAAAVVSLEGGIDAGPELVESWRALSSFAANDGISMFVASGYRSFEQQQAIFVNRLARVAGEPLLSPQTTDAAIDLVLDSHAPPGFSKHQTGNAIDIAEPGSVLEQFRQTDAFGWLTEDNYANARQFGFVPSYPDGVEGLGPEPEPWEWLWVGVDVLFRCPPSN